MRVPGIVLLVFVPLCSHHTDLCEIPRFAAAKSPQNVVTQVASAETTIDDIVSDQSDTQLMYPQMAYL